MEEGVEAGVKDVGNFILGFAKDFDIYIRKHNLENSQYFIDWQDELNKLSVK